MTLRTRLDRYVRDLKHAPERGRDRIDRDSLAARLFYLLRAERAPWSTEAATVVERDDLDAALALVARYGEGK